jgi:predicted acylesterase/phospholipase RssA
MSGGGAKGAYEAGVLQGLTSLLKPEETSWDVVTGISAGSLLTAFLGTYKVGDEAKAADAMVELTTSMTQKTIFKNWALGPLEGILDKRGLYDTSPERAFIDEQLKGGLVPVSQGGRRLVVGATSDNTGMLQTWNETATASEMAEAVMCSSAIPGVFPAQEVTSGTHKGELFSDGGVLFGVNVYDAVLRCRELVGDGRDEAITVDVVLCEGEHINDVSERSADKEKSLGVLLRSLDVMRYANAMADVDDARVAYPDVNFRYLVYPSVPLNGTLDFDPANLAYMVQVGQRDARMAVELPNQGRKCDYATRAVPCTKDKDCVNWAVGHCPDTHFAKRACRRTTGHNQRTSVCTFSEAPALSPEASGAPGSPDWAAFGSNVVKSLEGVLASDALVQGAQPVLQCMESHCLSEGLACLNDAGCKTVLACVAKCPPGSGQGACAEKCVGPKPDPATTSVMDCAISNKCVTAPTAAGRAHWWSLW